MRKYIQTELVFGVLEHLIGQYAANFADADKSLDEDPNSGAKCNYWAGAQRALEFVRDTLKREVADE